MATQDEIIRLDVKYNDVAGGEALNVFFFRVLVAILSDPEVLQALVDWITNDWATTWDSLAGTSSELTSVEVSVVNPDGTTNRTIGSQNINHAGSVAGASTPGGVAGYLQANTAIPKTRGRKFVPFLADNSVTAGYLASGALGPMAALLTDYLTNVPYNTVDVLGPGVLSRTLLQFVPFNNSGTYTDVPAYQRRRKPGVGT